MSSLNVHDLTPVLDTNAYADNDVMFVAIELPQFFDKNVPVVLQSIVACDDADQGVDFDLIFSNANITLGTINAAVNISDADANKIIGYVRFVAADANDTINNQIYTKTGIGLVMEGAGSQSVWVSGIIRSGTPTYAAGSLKLKIGVI